MSAWLAWLIIAFLGAICLVLAICLGYVIHLLMHMFDGF